MSSKSFDYIIIGQGLAGSILAMQLMQSGQTVLVIDNNHHKSASTVAAGIINPITGPRLSLQTDFDQYYAAAKSTFKTLETLLNINIWRDLNQQRLIKDQGQFDYYQKRSTDTPYQPYLGTDIKSEYFDPSSLVINIMQSAVIDCKSLLAACRRYLIEKQSLVTLKLTYSDIVATSDGFILNGNKGNRIIFCEGHQAIHNPWLKHLPFLLSKGEILTVETTQSYQGLLNWGNWLAHTGGETKLGSNYERDNLSLGTNENIKQSLLDSLHANTKLNAHVVKHESGIRPTTKHRTPFIGALNNLNNAYCFNGFGSKGCLLIPYFAQLLSNSFLLDEPLPKELTRWL